MIRELVLFFGGGAAALLTLVALAEWAAPSPPAVLVDPIVPAQALAVPAPMCPTGPVARPRDSRRIA